MLGGNADTCSFELTVLQTEHPELGNDTMVVQGDTLVLTVGGGFASVVWSTGETGPSILVVPISWSNQYFVTTIDQNGCEASDTILLGTLGTGIEDATNDTWSIYPNPAVDQLIFRSTKADQTYCIIAMDGTVVLEGRTQGKEGLIDIRSLASGVYAFQSRGPNGSIHCSIGLLKGDDGAASGLTIGRSAGAVSSRLCDLP